MLVPLSKKPETALIVPLKDKLPVVPASVKVASVLASPSAKVMVLSTPAVPRVTVGALLVSASGEAPDNVTKPEAAIVVAPEIAPVLVIPPELLFNPPLI